MTPHIERLLELAADWEERAPAADAGAALFSAVRGLGATFLNSRVYFRPSMGLDPERLWRLNGFQNKLDPPGWTQSEEHAFICVGHNPLIEAPKRGLRQFRFSDLAPKANPDNGAYWEAWSRIQTGDGIGLLEFADDGRNATLALGFERLDALTKSETNAIALAGRALLRATLKAGVGAPPKAALTARERDVMALVTRGLTDEAIAGALGLRPTTARAHADSARRKLDAANRAEAAALFVRWGHDRPD